MQQLAFNPPPRVPTGPGRWWSKLEEICESTADLLRLSLGMNGTPAQRLEHQDEQHAGFWRQLRTLLWRNYLIKVRTFLFFRYSLACGS
jgi:hypothetical protein